MRRNTPSFAAAAHTATLSSARGSSQKAWPQSLAALAAATHITTSLQPGSVPQTRPSKTSAASTDRHGTPGTMFDNSPFPVDSKAPSVQPDPATFHGYLHTVDDALLLIEATRVNRLPRMWRRLHPTKEAKFVRSGAIFVFDELEAGVSHDLRQGYRGELLLTHHTITMVLCIDQTMDRRKDHVVAFSAIGKLFRLSP